MPFMVEAAELVVHDAWMREVPPTSSVGAIYLDIENQGSVACAITDVSIAAPFTASLHQSVHAGERVRMQAVDAIPIRAGERLKFVSTGHHLMIDFGGQRAPAPGTKLMLQLTACDHQMQIESEVRRDAGDGSDHEHHHH